MPIVCAIGAACSQPPAERMTYPATDYSSVLGPEARRFEQNWQPFFSPTERTTPIIVRMSDGASCSLRVEHLMALVPNEELTQDIWDPEQWNCPLTAALLAKVAELEARVAEMERASDPDPAGRWISDASCGLASSESNGGLSHGPAKQ